MDNVKKNGTFRAKVIYAALAGLQIIISIAALLVIIGKVTESKNMLVASVLAIIVIGLSMAVVILKLVQDEEKESAQKSDKYKKLFLNLPVGFAQAQILRDPQTGRNMGYKISDANETFGRMFNLDISDYYNKVISDSKVEVLQDINAWFEAYNNSGTKLGELLAVEITMENLEKVFNTVMYKSEADYINMVVIDITEQKETENKLSKAIKDANSAYKTQSEFLANMSHEIRTPINGILGMLQLTLMSEDLQADHRDNLTTAKNCADTLLRLINDILDISKLEAGKYNLREENFDVRAAIEETIAAQVPIAQNKGLTLDCSFGSDVPKLVRGDEQRIQQVLNCLLSNAIKFTSEGGVRVKVACIDDLLDKIKLRIAVADSGIGISDADKNKLFIRFSQVDASDTRKYGGSGLGLVITKQIVELMGGNITVQSKEGLGSTFIVEVPLKIIKPAEVSEEAKAAAEAENEPAVFSLSGHTRARILVAEDEPVNQQVIGKLLGMAGYSYDIAENGEKAVELFKQKEYKAALFDVQMPVMDGLAATQEIRDIEFQEKRKRLPIIAVTARAMFGDKERILEAKLDDYIAKPYNLNDVVEILNKYVETEE
ncbi:MAG: response regulator [Lachnospiraceae bacterium]|jgi:signal transduction histidine kinase/ActR/RegA family two-component response regulator|nr:response regulator [Lachnospiraceae bacterium]